jgi:RES domain-containing protein
MRIVRLCRRKYPKLDGVGAGLAGGRWNSPKTNIVYASSCAALAVLEYRVHTRVDPADLLLLTIEIPDGIAVETVTWMPDIGTSTLFGDKWVASERSPVLAVPSVVIPRQFNYLLNPKHRDLSGAIKIVDEQPFFLDIRLFSLLPLS